MTQNDTGKVPFHWNCKSDQAAAHVAEDRLTDEQIAAKVGVCRATLARWKKHTEFAERVREHVAAFRAEVRAKGIAVLENRVHEANKRHALMRQIVEERAWRAASERAGEAAVTQALADKLKAGGATDAEIADALGRQKTLEPGMETGLIVLKETFTKNGRVVEYAMDTGLLSEMRAHEMQVAKDLGQLVTRQEIDLHDSTSTESLERKLAGLAAAQSADGLPEQSDGGGA